MNLLYKNRMTWIMACTLVLFAQTSVAESRNDTHRTDDGTYSWIPYTSSGYVGLNLGIPKFHTSCDGSLRCDNPPIAGKIYAGGMLSNGVGLELGYVNMGRAERNGGYTTAQGINLSLVGNLPMNDKFNAFGKVGAIYGWTDTSASPSLVSYNTGYERGIGLSYGAGFAVNVRPKTQIVLEWDRQGFNFKDSRADIDLYSIGVKYIF